MDEKSKVAGDEVIFGEEDDVVNDDGIVVLSSMSDIVSKHGLDEASVSQDTVTVGNHTTGCIYGDGIGISNNNNLSKCDEIVNEKKVTVEVGDNTCVEYDGGSQPDEVNESSTKKSRFIIEENNHGLNKLIGEVNPDTTISTNSNGVHTADAMTDTQIVPDIVDKNTISSPVLQKGRFFVTENFPTKDFENGSSVSSVAYDIVKDQRMEQKLLRVIDLQNRQLDILFDMVKNISGDEKLFHHEFAKLSNDTYELIEIMKKYQKKTQSIQRENDG